MSYFYFFIFFVYNFPYNDFLYINVHLPYESDKSTALRVTPPPLHIEMENAFAVQTCIIEVRVLKGK